MRLGVQLVCVLMVLGWPAWAAADSYHWSGRIGRLEVSSHVSGFAEGAGVGGWTPREVRQFVTWARPLSDSLPTGVSVEIEASEDEGVVVVVKRCPRGLRKCQRPSVRTYRAPIEGPWIEPSEPEGLVGFVEKLVGTRRRPRAEERGPIYTIQVLATPDENLAEARAELLRERLPAVPATMYTSTCAPCDVREAKLVPEHGPDGERHLVLLGNFATTADATRALKALRAAGVSDGFVRELPQ
ncbi:SPOR domain-containing protein [Nannocystis punicea]|uniref:SPOR domain-containing protein n=1 Tax=Nannocystis punicea TaxID=2995304 RepID=A0ABY7GS39_9BACT|nr:SPOR domain-containing protein [Nannocystis poenicansa]WAS89679.1 SPOR domain-containing protein [Nannocystis poenicansa]